MTETPCPREERVVQAVRSDRWHIELRAHVDACSSCADVAATTALFASEARAVRPAPPDSKAIHARAVATLHARHARTAAWPIVALTWLARAAGGVAAAYVLAWQWPLVESAFDALVAGLRLPAELEPNTFAWAPALFLVALVGSLYSAWTED